MNTEKGLRRAESTMAETPSYIDPDVATLAGVGVTLPDAASGGLDKRAFERGEVLGRYVVLEKLGHGGMGFVMAAYDAKLDRRIALKLLHPHASGNPENHARLLREAQSLAKLSHPGVVSVYDVGELRGHVFIAMEYVDGPDLRAWLKASERSTAEIVAVYRDAARGLQAAHDAGIIHRDFKPDNVLIGSDGRARVTDFGLALDAVSAASHSSEGPSQESFEGSGRLTEAGVVMGTPAYMPMEQHMGKPTDHRSDQYSFCVSMYESLYGLRPFSGANGVEYCQAIRRGAVAPPPASTSVPRRVHRALLRGLSAEPDDRFPSMRALVAAMTPPAKKRRTWVLGGLGTLGGLAVGAGVVTLTDPPRRPCSGFDARIEGVLGDAQRRSIRSAFFATEVPLAKRSYLATITALDAFADAWTESATAACMASERGEQSDRMLDLRMHCLDRGLVALSTLVEVFEGIDRSEVENAPAIAERLPDLGLCSDLETLPNLTVLPETPAQTRDANTLLPVVERAGTLIIADRHEAGAKLLADNAEALEQSTYPLVRTLYKMWAGRVHFSRRETKEARVLLEQAHLLALEHGLDVQAARSAIALGLSSNILNEPEAATRWLDSAGALARAAGSNRMQATVLASSVDVLTAEGRLDEAVEAARRAVELTADEPGMPVRARVDLLLVYASTLHHRDGGDAGIEALDEARALVKDERDLPTLSKIADELNRRAVQRGDFKAALEHSSESIRLARLAYGPTAPRYAAAIANLALPLEALGRHDEAIARYEQAAELLGRKSGTEYPRALLQVNITSGHLTHGELDEARAHLEALRTAVEKHGYDRRAVGLLAKMLRSMLLLAEGDARAALDPAEAALEQAEAQFGPSHFRTADALTNIANIELALGRLDDARAHVDRARAYGSTVPGDRARAAFVLARILWMQDEDPERALALAREARADLIATPSHPVELAAVEAWLDEHDPTRRR